MQTTEHKLYAQRVGIDLPYSSRPVCHCTGQHNFLAHRKLPARHTHLPVQAAWRLVTHYDHLENITDGMQQLSIYDPVVAVKVITSRILLGYHLPSRQVNCQMFPLQHMSYLFLLVVSCLPPL